MANEGQDTVRIIGKESSVTSHSYTQLKLFQRQEKINLVNVDNKIVVAETRFLCFYYNIKCALLYRYTLKFLSKQYWK